MWLSNQVTLDGLICFWNQFESYTSFKHISGLIVVFNLNRLFFFFFANLNLTISHAIPMHMTKKIAKNRSTLKSLT